MGVDLKRSLTHNLRILFRVYRVFATVRKCQGSGLLRLQMKGVKLKNVEGFFSKSDPFFELAKKIDAAGGQTWYVQYSH
jgi:hypothetical protein